MDITVGAPAFNQAVKRFMGWVESVNVHAIPRADFECGEETLVCDIAMKKGYPIEDLEFAKILGSLEVLKTDGRTYVVFCSRRCASSTLTSSGPLLCINPATRSVLTPRRQSELEQGPLLLMSTYGEVRNVVFEEASFSRINLLDQLTPCQRDLLIAAKRYGYY